MPGGNFLFTSESVTEGHPDKMCDQISDGVLDEVLRRDPHGRVACETFVTVGLVIVGGEITTDAWVDIERLVRGVVKRIGYVDPTLGFSYDSCAILNAIGQQSPDIKQGVDTGGAGDQGLMCGYASRETAELMPMPIQFAHKLCRRLAEVRKKAILPYLGPDGKAQVTIEYEEGRPRRCEAIVVSTQHRESILDATGKKITEQARAEIIQNVVAPVIPADMIDARTKFYVNPTGRFVIGGPRSDTGMTGRKIIVDTYGGMAAHGGGAFSGKDPTKVDRSASYMARYIAKNVVASGIAEKCTLQVAYAIGVAEPVSLTVFADGTAKIPERRIAELIRKHFDLTPRGIIEKLNLLRPIYSATAAYGHFGREESEFTWERTDMAAALAKDA
ncbi:MAG TPA: methionine adenosyltransferase [candidate division Zixibacteria bacterium]|nr:methionine adenosyltransferase [candidate division Zixibacteria bacterium]MDD4917630.1 methionine adenosyltransferase [candidate division Zixibacteria bacterium]MDM7972111.1 methionine adenosyltransferase [candidate division Zixibacteria bacterium]HOD65552.1 methionine adenosyltransferase [candidate division Zixibacteria bacterium]HOZ08929.1 methionine adenosyltransferase [candidate division Zixibacteria bacterium]